MQKVKFKKGAASFYVVAFSTLILLIIAASFTALVVAQITRSSNADLAQSAYDSALAGVEDAKLAFYSYRNCLEQGKTAKDGELDYTDGLDCEEIISVMEKSNDDCDMVAKILGRTGEEGGEVEVKETSGNNMSQAYTCVKIETDLPNYYASLSANEQIKVVRPTFKDVKAEEINSMRISWGMNEGNGAFSYSNFNPVFRSLANFGTQLNPPVLSVAILQAGDSFDLDDFDKVGDDKTNRGMVYLVPKDPDQVLTSGESDPDYIIRDAGENKNTVFASDMVKSNDRTSKNKPFAITCDNEGDFICSATIDLPMPIEGDRSDDNFVIVVALPYGKSNTPFELEFCKNREDCSSETIAEGEEESTGGPVILKGLQIGVDSTGRANDLFRRVETRLEEKDESLLSIMGPLELSGDGGNGGNGGSDQGAGDALQKNIYTICEWNFAKTCE